MKVIAQRWERFNPDRPVLKETITLEIEYEDYQKSNMDTRLVFRRSEIEQQLRSLGFYKKED